LSFRTTTVLVFVVVTMITWGAEAQYPVYFVHSGEDSVGKRIAYNVEKEIAASPLFVKADVTQSHWSISLVTLEVGDYLSAYSLVITVCPVLALDPGQEFLVTHYVGSCGSDRVALCAESISANVVSSFKDFAYGGDYRSLPGVVRIVNAVEAGMEFTDFKRSIPEQRLLIETVDDNRR
jgi:hypothetical protein